MRWITDLWWRLVRFGFRLLYNEMAFTYDAVSWMVSLGDWRAWQRTSLNFLPDPSQGRVLELAHGTGHMQTMLADRGYDVVGLDASKAMGHIARRRVIRAGERPNLIRAHGQTLPLPARSFSSVVSTFPTPFIFEESTLSDVHRVLHDNGVLIIVIAGVFKGRGVVRSILEFLYRITGQRQESDTSVQEMLSGRFYACGFDAHFEIVELAKSEAHLIIVRKRSGI